MCRTVRMRNSDFVNFAACNCSPQRALLERMRALNFTDDDAHERFSFQQSSLPGAQQIAVEAALPPVTDASERRYAFSKVSTRGDYIFYIYNLGFPLSLSFFCVTALLLVTCSRAASRHPIGPLKAARDAARILGALNKWQLARLPL
ncbi:hypothetical protein NDU88_003649 [Pleurodeles waltl]|uniref:Uncharacterized protein n=1 Tax=Pleurodeles waltl TaxID=8319 RepID=A0AAV7Q9Z2_PLEWA|nr:hypothetical protein NDU88_003649 [Pleurodeles waltl]